MTIFELANTLGVPEPSVRAVLLACSAVHNVGSATYPIWTWRIGNATSTEFLVATIRRLITERAMSTRQLALATGADIVRVARAIAVLEKRERLSMFYGMWFR